MKNYIFIDPVNREYAGITSYTKIASKLLCNEYTTYIISKKQNENIKKFSERVKYTIEQNFSWHNTIIEAPDTYHPTFYIKNKYYTHIRLHGMKHIFDIINKNKIDIKNYLCDLYQIQNCNYLSSPSNIIKTETEKYIYTQNVNIYPNPIHRLSIDSLNNKDIDILYIGRMQKNKGKYYLEQIFSDFTNYKIYLYSKDARNIDLKNKNIVIVNCNKYALLKRAKVVIVPSYIESFSQVAGEGISNGCQIVTWNSIGITEYSGSMIHSIDFGNIDKFIESIHNSLSNNLSLDDYNRYIEHNNSIYLSWIKKIKLERVFYCRPATFRIFDNTNGEVCTMLKKKMKKLVRDPKRFYVDSKVYKIIYAIINRKKHINDDKINEAPKTIKNNLNIYSKIDNKNIINNHIGVNNFIKCKDIKIDKSSRNTIIFIEEYYNINNIVNIMKEKCKSINFNDRYFYEYIYKDSVNINDDDIRNIIRTFDKSFIETISKFNILLFINPKTKIYSLLRSYFPSTKILIILTNEFKNFEIISPKQIDALILQKNLRNKLEFSNLRRYFLFDDEVELCKALDVYTNETSTKHHNMLLKIYGDVPFDPKYMDMNTDIINCIIYINGDCAMNNISFPTWSDYIKYISNNIESIMVTENIFFQYKELILSSIKNHNWQNFLLLATYDGVRFVIYA